MNSQNEKVLELLDKVISDSRFKKAFESKRDFLAFLIEIRELLG